MSDNLNKTGLADASRINVHQRHEVTYWCNKLGCSEARLRQAVDAVGVMVVNVREWLRTH